MGTGVIALHFNQISFTTSRQKRADNFLPILIQSDNLYLRRCPCLLSWRIKIKYKSGLCLWVMRFAARRKLVQICTNFSKSSYTCPVRWLVFISSYSSNVREHIAKVRGYGRKAALETQNHTVSAGCNCFNKTWEKRVAQDQSYTNEISETYSRTESKSTGRHI